jgi:hypothetical protein
MSPRKIFRKFNPALPALVQAQQNLDERTKTASDNATKNAALMPSETPTWKNGQCQQLYREWKESHNEYVKCRGLNMFDPRKKLCESDADMRKYRNDAFSAYARCVRK